MIQRLLVSLRCRKKKEQQTNKTAVGLSWSNEQTQEKHECIQSGVGIEFNGLICSNLIPNQRKLCFPQLGNGAIIIIEIHVTFAKVTAESK